MPEDTPQILIESGKRRSGNDIDSGSFVSTFLITTPELTEQGNFDPLLRATYNHDTNKLHLRLPTEKTEEEFRELTNEINESFGKDDQIDRKVYPLEELHEQGDARVSSPYGVFFYIPRANRSPLIIVNTHVRSIDPLIRYVVALGKNIPQELAEEILMDIEKASPLTEVQEDFD